MADAHRRSPHSFAEMDWADMNFVERLRKITDDEECTEICWQPGNDGIIVKNKEQVEEKYFRSFTRTMYDWGFKKGISPRTKRNHTAPSVSPPSRENKSEEYWHHRVHLFIREDADTDFALLRLIKYKSKRATRSNASNTRDDNTGKTASVSSMSLEALLRILSDPDDEESSSLRRSKRKFPSNNCDGDNDGCNVALDFTAPHVDEKLNCDDRHAEPTQLTFAEKFSSREGGASGSNSISSNGAEEMSWDGSLSIGLGEPDKQEESIEINSSVVSESPSMHRVISQDTTVKERLSRASARFWSMVKRIFDAHYECAARHAGKEDRPHSNSNNNNDNDNTQDVGCDLTLATMSYAAFADQLDLLGKMSYLTLKLPYATCCKDRTSFFRRSSPRTLQRANACDFRDSNDRRRSASSQASSQADACTGCKSEPYGSFNIHTFVRDFFPNNVPDKVKGPAPSPSRRHSTKDQTFSDFSLHRDWFQKKLQDLLSARYAIHTEEEELAAGDTNALDTLTEQLECLHRVTFGALPEGFVGEQVEAILKDFENCSLLEWSGLVGNFGANDSFSTPRNGIPREVCTPNTVTLATAAATPRISAMTEKKSAPRSSAGDTAELQALNVTPKAGPCVEAVTRKQAPRFFTTGKKGAISPMQLPRRAFAAVTVHEKTDCVEMGGFNNSTHSFVCSLE